MAYPYGINIKIRRNRLSAMWNKDPEGGLSLIKGNWSMCLTVTLHLPT